MAYDAKVIEIIVASPTDVEAERQIIREVLAEWNAIYSRDRMVVLLPLGWETHSSPELGGRPQQLINDRILAHADVLVGVFWTRVGTPTGKALSGSIEEIEEHLRCNKPVMLYFSELPVAPAQIDQNQYKQLGDFRSWARSKGLVESFSTHSDFRTKFSNHLPLMLSNNKMMKALVKQGETAVVGSITPSSSLEITLSEDGRNLLVSAANSEHGAIYRLRHLAGTTIQAGDQVFGEASNRRSIAQWEGAILQLKKLGLIKDVNGKGDYFEVTDRGYLILDHK